MKQTYKKYIMNIKVLGTGCASCKALEKNTRAAIAALKLEATIEKEEDIQAIMAYGIMSTPALVIDEKVISSGKKLTQQEIEKLLSDN